MPKRVRLRSLAKLNLDLRVLHKRPDGFHELRTVFQTISLADTIEIEYQRGHTRIELKSNLNIADNLIVRAADMFLEATGKTGRLRFSFTKRIPLGAGLGGGSSNAASVLLALPVLLGKPVPLEVLVELAARLGSDVPFFLLGGAAVGLGRGTELYPLPDFPSWPALVIAPGIHSSTPDAYHALGRQPAAEASARAIHDFQSVVWQSGTNRWTNDFEEVVFRAHPQLELIKGKLLKLRAWRAMMTGSGSALFGLFPNRELRDRAARSFRREFASKQVYPVTLVSRARYRALWRRQLMVSLESNIWPPQDRYAR